ncbi:hypothetical protein [Solimonas soli]|uniref:hypothetical protein n=1 Tax=Solimonas soli TaxID=413479 RepID=UPI0004843E99|nr:hypothetical protein [Solimonas soli]
MKKRALPAAIALLLAIAGGWFYWHRQHDGFDYEAVFERAGADAGGTATLVDLKAIAGKDRNAVRDLLGEPQRCETGEFSERCRYARAEITYIAGKADWITVTMGGDMQPLLPQTLAALGLPVRDPDEVNEHENIWRDLAGYREVRLVGGDQGAIYARIKVATL